MFIIFPAHIEPSEGYKTISQLPRFTDETSAISKAQKLLTQTRPTNRIFQVEGNRRRCMSVRLDRSKPLAWGKWRPNKSPDKIPDFAET